MLVADIGGEHLVDTARWLINEPLLGIQYLDPLGECWAHPHHISRHIENDGRLLTVRSTAIDFGSFLSVTAGEQKCHRSGKLGLALLFRNFDVGRIELPIAVGLENAEDVPNDLLLPVNKLEGLSRPGAFGVAQALDEHHSVVCGICIVVGGFLHEPCRRVFLQFSRRDHLLGIKNTALWLFRNIREKEPFGSVPLWNYWVTSFRCGAEAPAQAVCFHRRVRCPNLCRSCRRCIRCA